MSENSDNFRYPISGETHPLLPHWFDVAIEPVDVFEVELRLNYNDINHKFGPWTCEMLWDNYQRPTGFIRCHFEKAEDATMARLMLGDDG